MSPKAIAVAGLSAIAIAVSGCTGDESEVEKFQAAFKERFGETSWYGYITGMKINPVGNLEITTNLDSPSPEGKIERGICGRAVRLALDLGVLPDEFGAVEMKASDGVGLGGCG